jgi:ABC-type amino acid transport substrate-binding protein
VGRLILPAVLVVSTLPAVAAADWEEVKRRGALRVVTNDIASGAFEHELMDGFAKLNGITIQVVRGKALAERIPALLAGDADVAMSLFDTPERRRLVDFTVEVLPTVYTITTCRPQRPVKSIEELRTRRVGVLTGSIMEAAAQRAAVPPDNIVGVSVIIDLVEALCGGRVTAALIAVPNVAALRPRFPGLEYGAPMDQVQSAAWAVRKQDAQLKRVLDDYITNVRRSGRWNRLIVKHFGAEALTVLGRAGQPSK